MGSFSNLQFYQDNDLFCLFFSIFNRWGNFSVDTGSPNLSPLPEKKTNKKARRPMQHIRITGIMCWLTASWRQLAVVDSRCAKMCQRWSVTKRATKMAYQCVPPAWHNNVCYQRDLTKSAISKLSRLLGHGIVCFSSCVWYFNNFFQIFKSNALFFRPAGLSSDLFFWFVWLAYRSSQWWS